MCKHCLSIYNKQVQYDPTHTLTLRNSFVKAVRRRFKLLKKKIKEAIINDDCFGLQYKEDVLGVNIVQKKAFDFPRDSEKIAAFMAWLQQQVEDGLLDVEFGHQIGFAIEEPWTNMYIKQAYKTGIDRARKELKKAGYIVPTIVETGGIDVVFGGAFHADRVGVAYTRCFSELKAITADMDKHISNILGVALSQGQRAPEIYKNIATVISGPITDPKTGKKGILDSIGRFIPAERRAMTIARTEIIRAHHMATVREYENWKTEGVYVKAEWSTSKDDRVCEECAQLEGKIYTIEEIQLLIPRHPNCRCIALPVDVTDMVRE